LEYVMRSVPLSLLWVLLILSACAPAPTQGVSPTDVEPATVVPTDATLDEPAIASTATQSAPAFELVDIPAARSLSITVGSDGMLYLAHGRDRSLFVSRSTDGGRTFSEAVHASRETPVHVLPIERPAIAASGEGRVSVAWLEVPRDFNGATVWHALSVDGGEIFGTAVQVTVEEQGEVTMVVTALDEEGNPFLVWLNGSALRFSRSFDGGETFSEPVTIGDGSCECCQPQIVVRGEDVHIAYRSLEPGNEAGDIRDIVMISSEDAGGSFQPVRRVSDAHWYLPACPIAGPSLAADDGRFLITWMDGRSEPPGTFGRGDVWLATSQDGGATFSANVRINPDEDMHHTLPTVAVGPGGRIHVAWEAHPQGPGQVLLYYSTSDDGGLTFAPPQIIADGSDSSRGNPAKPVLGVDPSGHVTLAWLDRQGARIAFWTDER
jgi:hypothetical protein